jgi:hypothetical protein
LYFLSLDDLRILITLLVSSNSSCPYRASELNPSLRRVYGAWSLVFCAVFCRSLVFFCPLYCLSFDIRILINYRFGIFKLFLSLLKPLKFKTYQKYWLYFQRLWCHLQLTLVSTWVHLKTLFFL